MKSNEVMRELARQYDNEQCDINIHIRYTKDEHQTAEEIDMDETVNKLFHVQQQAVKNVQSRIDQVMGLGTQEGADNFLEFLAAHKELVPVMTRKEVNILTISRILDAAGEHGFVVDFGIRYHPFQGAIVTSFAMLTTPEVFEMVDDISEKGSKSVHTDFFDDCAKLAKMTDTVSEQVTELYDNVIRAKGLAGELLLMNLVSKEAATYITKEVLSRKDGEPGAPSFTMRRHLQAFYDNVLSLPASASVSRGLPSELEAMIKMFQEGGAEVRVITDPEDIDNLSTPSKKDSIN